MVIGASFSPLLFTAIICKSSSLFPQYWLPCLYCNFLFVTFCPYKLAVKITTSFTKFIELGSVQQNLVQLERFSLNLWLV